MLQAFQKIPKEQAR